MSYLNSRPEWAEKLETPLTADERIRYSKMVAEHMELTENYFGVKHGHSLSSVDDYYGMLKVLMENESHG